MLPPAEPAGHPDPPGQHGPAAGDSLAPSDPPAPASDPLAALAADLAATTTGAVVLTGAGVSAASGVPAFRDPGGLWERYDPREYATIEALRHHPRRVWRFLRELDDLLEAAEPNPAHRALADLEDQEAVRAVITQNVDGLHQAAGSERVIELHGSRLTVSCLECGARETREQALGRTGDDPVPWCPRCGGLVKPDVTLFGEPLPRRALERARQEVATADLLMVAGTSAEVEPAADLPRQAAAAGTTVWEVNPQPALPRARAVAVPAESALPAVSARLESRGGPQLSA